MTRTRTKHGRCILLALSLSFGAVAQNPLPSFVSQFFSDSIVHVASLDYEANSVLRRLFMGDNYRAEWAQAVQVPVFHFTGSGFVAKDLGGGMQTKSLHMVDAQGKYWGLRTVNKKITDGGLSPGLRNSLGRKFSQDFISAGFPYAVPLAGELAHAAGINAARARIFYVADDPGLGEYRAIFAGTLCTLEERDPGFDNTDNSETFLANLRNSNRYKVQQAVYLKARLLDMLIADWDRHAGNWRWGLKDSAGFLFYHAVPRDRDWAFYYSKGWLPWLAQKTGAVKCFVPFDEKLKKLKAQCWKSWTMDRELTNELDEAAWTKILDEFTASLTDEALENAVRTAMPASIYALDGESFVRKLKSRRDALPKEALMYYRFLVEEPVVNGSDEAETFVLTPDDDGLRLTVYAAGNKERPVYQRHFLNNKTYRLTLNGFGGDDAFVVDENAASKIRIVINGGEGNDSYDLQGAVRTRVFDAKEKSKVLHDRKTAFCWQPAKDLQ